MTRNGTTMNSLSFIEFELVNRIIYELYNPDLPLHTRAVAFLRNVMEVVYYDCCTIIFFYLREDGIYEKHSSISINWDRKKEIVEQYNMHYCHYDDTLPVMDNPNPVIFRASSFFDLAKRKTNPYWNEYLLPNNCVHSLEGNIHITNTNGIKGGFSFYRGTEKNDFTLKEMSIIKLFQCHLSSIFKYYGEKNDFTETFFLADSSNKLGVCIIDSNYRVIQQNMSFKTLTHDKGNITHKAIQLAMKLNGKAKEPMNTTIGYKFDDIPLFMEVSIIHDREPNKCQFICLVYDLSYYFTESLKKAKDKYRLTAREFDILKLILSGKKNNEIASDLYLSLPTVKKYLASVYSKMEIESQKQILEKLNVL